jgi:hypothetical protein
MPTAKKEVKPKEEICSDHIKWRGTVIGKRTVIFMILKTPK